MRAMKEQLHRHARDGDRRRRRAGCEVRAIWKSDETRARISAFLDALK
jgi:enoyl-CoA hydratase